MVQGYAHENSGSACGRQALPYMSITHKSARGIKISERECFRPYPFGASHDKWSAHFPEEFKLSESEVSGGEIEEPMLSVTCIF